MKKVLGVIGGGVMASYFSEAAMKLGYDCHYFSLSDGRINENDSTFFHDVNIFEKDLIVELCRKHKVDGIVATTELTISVAAYVADKLGLIGNPVEVAEKISDKYRNRECIKYLTTLKSPRYVECCSFKDIESAQLTYPVIIKPTNLGGKRGIAVVKEEKDLKAAYDYASKSFNSLQKSKIIVEEFLSSGVECSVESISINGKHHIVQITQKESSGPPHCVELSHHQPANISKEEWNKVVLGVSDGLDAIGLREGCCHTEIKIVEGEVYLIEFNARPGGDHISHPMVKLSTGFDFIEALVRVAVGDPIVIDTSKFENRYAGLYYIVKQTDYLLPIFNSCQNQKWCYEKNLVTDQLVELKQNDMEHTNYMIYSSPNGDPVQELLNERSKSIIG